MMVKNWDLVIVLFFILNTYAVLLRLVSLKNLNHECITINESLTACIIRPPVTLENALGECQTTFKTIHMIPFNETKVCNIIQSGIRNITNETDFWIIAPDITHLGCRDTIKTDGLISEIFSNASSLRNALCIVVSQNRDRSFSETCNTYNLSYKFPKVIVNVSKDVFGDKNDAFWTNCSIIIKSLEPYSVMHIRIMDLNITKSHGCLMEYLQILHRDGNSLAINHENFYQSIADTKSLMGEYLKTKMLCGDWKLSEKLLQYTLTSPRNKLEEHFTSQINIHYYNHKVSQVPKIMIKAWIDKEPEVRNRQFANNLTVSENRLTAKYSEKSITKMGKADKYFVEVDLTNGSYYIEFKLSKLEFPYHPDCLYGYLSLRIPETLWELRFCGALSNNLVLKNVSVSKAIYVDSNNATSYEIDRHNNIRLNLSPNIQTIVAIENTARIITDSKVTVGIIFNRYVNTFPPQFVFGWRVLDLKSCHQNINLTTLHNNSKRRLGNKFEAYKNSMIQAQEGYFSNNELEKKVPQLTCMTQISLNNPQKRILLTLLNIIFSTDVNMSNAGDNTCFQEYIVIEDFSPTNKYKNRSTMLCPMDMITLNNNLNFVSENEALMVYHVKQPNISPMINFYNFSYKAVDNLRLEETIKITQDSEQTNINSINYPHNFPPNVTWQLTFMSEEIGNVVLSLVSNQIFVGVNDTLLCENYIQIQDPFKVPLLKKTFCPISVNDFHNQTRENNTKNQSQILMWKEPLVMATSWLHVLIITIITNSKSTNDLASFTISWDSISDPKFETKANEVNINALKSLPLNKYCAHNSTFSGNTCNCLEPYKGPFCLIHECDGYDCNLGDCKFFNHTKTCVCDDFHGGPRCEYEVCESQFCNNQGICLIQPANSTKFCQCYFNYAGSDCSLKFPFENFSPAEKFLQEPFWMGIFVVIIVLILLGCIMLYQRKWKTEYRCVFCNDWFLKKKMKWIKKSSPSHTSKNSSSNEDISSLDNYISHHLQDSNQILNGHTFMVPIDLNHKPSSPVVSNLKITKLGYEDTNVNRRASTPLQGMAHEKSSEKMKVSDPSLSHALGQLWRRGSTPTVFSSKNMAHLSHQKENSDCTTNDNLDIEGMIQKHILPDIQESLDEIGQVLPSEDLNRNLIKNDNHSFNNDHLNLSRVSSSIMSKIRKLSPRKINAKEESEEKPKCLTEQKIDHDPPHLYCSHIKKNPKLKGKKALKVARNNLLIGYSSPFSHGAADGSYVSSDEYDDDKGIVPSLSRHKAALLNAFRSPINFTAFDSNVLAHQFILYSEPRKTNLKNIFDSRASLVDTDGRVIMRKSSE